MNATGSKEVPFNASGLVVVRGWYATPSANYGVTIQDYNVGDNDLQFRSSEWGALAERPKLNIRYCVPVTCYNLVLARTG